jgi:hypothetical protein
MHLQPVLDSYVAGRCCATGNLFLGVHQDNGASDGPCRSEYGKAGLLEAREVDKEEE